MSDLPTTWFDPVRLFANGYPEGITSAVRALDTLREQLRGIIDGLGAQSLVEIGPGDCPLAPIDRAVFVDIAPIFLANLPSDRCVIADIRKTPFDDHAFDALIAADVLTHIRPDDREGVLLEMARIAHTVCIFNPEPGTPEVEHSQVATDALEKFFVRHGYLLDTRHFLADTDAGPYPMAMLVARPGPPGR